MPSCCETISFTGRLLLSAAVAAVASHKMSEYILKESDSMFVPRECPKYEGLVRYATLGNLADIIPWYRGESFQLLLMLMVTAMRPVVFLAAGFLSSS